MSAMDVSGLIDDPAALTPERLTGILPLSAGRVISVEQTPGPVTMPSMCTYLTLAYSDDAAPARPARLFFKLSNPGNPPFEVEFYTELASVIPDPPLVECYHAGYDEEAEQYHLLLRDASDTHLALKPPRDWQQGDWLHPARHQALALAESYARVHAAFWGAAAPAAPWGEDELAAFVRDECETTDEQIDGFLAAEDGRFAEVEPVLRRVAAQARGLVLRRVATGRHLTLTHGDANIWNAVYPRREGDRALLIDWITYVQYRRWVGAFDLANHIARFWHPWSRRFEAEALARYHAALVEGGVEGYGWEDLLGDYRLALLSAVNDQFYVRADNRRAQGRRIAENVFSCFADHQCEDLLE